MNDDRPLHVLASRAAHLFGIPLLDGQPRYPDDPRLRAFRIQGIVHTEAHRDVAPVWLEFGRGLTGGSSYELVVTDGGKFHRVLVTGRTPKAFRAAFDAAEQALEGAEALRPWRIR